MLLLAASVKSLLLEREVVVLKWLGWILGERGTHLASGSVKLFVIWEMVCEEVQGFDDFYGSNNLKLHMF